MPKYQVTIHFEVNDEFMTLVPPHRTYINFLINKGTIDHYAVTMETQRAWVTMNADDKKHAEKILKRREKIKKKSLAKRKELYQMEKLKT